MRTFVILLVGLLALGGFFAQENSVRADLSTAQARELRGLESEVRRVNLLIRNKEFDEAEKKLKEIEEKVAKIQKDAKVDDKDRAIANVKNAIGIQRKQLLKARPADPKNPDAAGGVSFAEDVLPILTKNCGGCHGATGNARGSLRLSSFENLRKGGKNAPLLVVGNANQSLIVRRITAMGDQKMPPGNRPSLKDEEIRTIRDWINQGAKDDTAEVMKKVLANIPKPTGKETISFTKDIAPFMVNLCLGCHSGNDPRGGLSLVTVKDLMKGGDSGEVIIPGDAENSRLFRLVGGLEAPRMPANQARLTRKNYEDLKKWFAEGNTFDVEDPTKPLRDIVPTDAEIAAERLAKLSDEEFAQHRIRRGQELWTNALSKQPFRWLENRDFIIYGDTDEERLKQIATWADEHAGELRKTFGEKDVYLWRGKLAIFVVKDRFDFEEFTSVNLGQQAPAEMHGFAKVTSTLDDAYIALHEVGDAPGETEPSLRTNLIEQITAAYLQKGEGGGNLPAWLTRGLGLYFAVQAQTEDPYLQRLKPSVPAMLQTVAKPADVFNDGTFSPSAVGAVGYTLVDYLIKAKGGGAPKLGQLIRVLRKGTKIQDAIKSVYKADPAAIAVQYSNSLKGGRRN